MRRLSIFLALAVVLLSAVVVYTYRLRVEKAKKARFVPTPQIKNGLEGVAAQGWHWHKDDPHGNKPIVSGDARSFQATHDPSTFELRGLALRLYNKEATSYTYVKTEQAFFDEGSGILKAAGPVSIMMNVPSDKDAEDKTELAKRVHVQTSGITYETKTGKANTDQPASFVFPKGNGTAVGAAYDPNTHILHLKSKISLDWVGDGPAERKMHIETADLVYNEAEQKVYLSPWSRLKRQTTTIQARNSKVTLQDGRLHIVEADHPIGTDDRENRHTDYSAEKMTGMFDEDGNLVQVIGQDNARVVATESGSRTTLTGDRADLRFAIDNTQKNGTVQSESNLHLVLADGHAIAESVPLPQPDVQLAETRLLRSQHIELEMKPGGQEVQEIRTSSQAQMEFKPNRPDQSHRIVDASHLRVLYGPNSYVDTFLAWKVATHTDKPVLDAKKTLDKDGKPVPPAPALTWSDELKAKFIPNSSQVATIEQTGNFRYEEGPRKSSAKKAFLEQTINRITLTDTAHVSDDTGAAMADTIVMNQANGDMDASGHVVSTHEPNRNQKPGTSMLDNTKAMQAKADQMQTREDNTKVYYQGHVVMWQGANRISAEAIDINRDSQALHALGDVVTESVDNKANDDAQAKEKNSGTQAQPSATSVTPPIFTIVRAPELLYRDDTRIALYTGGAKLTRGKMTMSSKEIQAFLNPKTDDNKDQSSLDHAFANGAVKIFEVVAPNRTRTGTAQHCEYYTKDDKVVLNGGTPQMVDSYKGTTKGHQLTYYSSDDRMIVEGEKKQLAYTQMKKK